MCLVFLNKYILVGGTKKNTNYSGKLECFFSLASSRTMALPQKTASYEGFESVQNIYITFFSRKHLL